MNATDLALFLHLRRTQTPAAPRPAAGTPGGPVEPLPPVAPARPATTGLPAHVVDHVLHLIDEHAGLAYQAGQFARLATQAGRNDPCAQSQHQTNKGHAEDLQATYYAEIRAYLQGEKQ